MSWAGADDFMARLKTRLIPAYGDFDLPEGGDIFHLDDDDMDGLRDAGVLIGVVDRGGELNVVLTERPKTMAKHPGQVAFPGGKLDPHDTCSVDAALREAHEEVGVDRETVTLIGRSSLYLTRTGFRITPVVGLLPPDFVARPDPHEVDDVFETPLSFLMNPENHEEKSVQWQGQRRKYFEMPYKGHYIWGVTAGIIHALYERLYSED